MNNHAGIICDAIKTAYRQSKDGYVVSFVIHPQEMPALLANADIGSQWQLRLVPLDEDGNAQVECGGVSKGMADRKAIPSHRTWDDLPAPQQAGILCSDPTFHRWLQEVHSDRWALLNEGEDNERAALIVRSLCHVKSRSEIPEQSHSLIAWKNLVSRYRDWMHEPELVG